jgi:hypothetical protein
VRGYHSDNRLHHTRVLNLTTKLGVVVHQVVFLMRAIIRKVSCSTSLIQDLNQDRSDRSLRFPTCSNRSGKFALKKHLIDDSWCSNKLVQPLRHIVDIQRLSSDRRSLSRDRDSGMLSRPSLVRLSSDSVLDSQRSKPSGLVRHLLFLTPHY